MGQAKRSSVRAILPILIEMTGKGKWIIMDHALLEMPNGVTPPFEVGTLGAIDAASSGETSVIRRSDESLIRQLTEVLDKQLLTALCSRSVSEFEAARLKAWVNYARARRALADTINLIIPANVIGFARAATAERIAADLERSRNVLFGDKVADQVEFSIWISDRMQALGREIINAGEPKDRDADRKLSYEFDLYATWGQFHYDSVLAAIKFDRPISEVIQGAVCDGLRAWVNASSIMEEALALRTSSAEELEATLPWDEEDQELLDSSMRDLDAESAMDI